MAMGHLSLADRPTNDRWPMILPHLSRGSPTLANHTIFNWARLLSSAYGLIVHCNLRWCGSSRHVHCKFKYFFSEPMMHPEAIEGIEAEVQDKIDLKENLEDKSGESWYTACFHRTREAQCIIMMTAIGSSIVMSEVTMMNMYLHWCLDIYGDDVVSTG